jgi:uncharacterized protein
MEYPGRIIGRKKEMAHLKATLDSNESALVAITGRRRVGKTFLVKKTFENEIVFLFTGQKSGTNRQQLENFRDKLQEYYSIDFTLAIPTTWSDAFKQLRVYILAIKTKTKPVLFIDEFPWLAQPKSGFLEAFEYFWNDFAVNQNIIIIICGSATSWMNQHVLANRGGLHNRVTKQIYLAPFNLKEVYLFFQDRKLDFTYYDIIQLYMTFGGIPYYLNEIQAGESAQQAIDRICFGKTAPLAHEFEQLYAALFYKYQNHISIVKALSSKWRGLTRNEIISLTGLSNGGGLTTILTELESSSFITSYITFGKSVRETIYRLTDEFSLFYLTFIHSAGRKKVTHWHLYSLTTAYKSWAGFAFESICLRHIKEIKQALGISGIYTEETAFISKDIPGTQIDLIIDRSDNSINLCEMKFYNSEFNLSAEESKKIRLKKELFKQATHTKKNLILTYITTYGLIQKDKMGSVDKELGMEIFFE